MNSNFNENQIEAYAAAFEEGDAVWCEGKWWKVSKRTKFSQSLSCEAPNQYVIRCYDGEVAIDGFREEEKPYRVTTLVDYELQGGEKVVSLSEFMDNIEFGKPYFVKSDSYGTPIITDDVRNNFVPDGKNWAVIPRYEQVLKNEESKFKKGDKVITPSGGTGTIYKKEMMGSGTVVCTVELIDKDGDCYRSKFREIDLKPYIEEPPAPKVEIVLDEVAIHSEIITRLVKQTIKGVKKYGDPVQHNNLSTVEWIDHAIDESVDQIVYLTALKHSLLSKEATK